jgi:hypothetical protein
MSQPIRIDAHSFQEPLAFLCQTMVEKVFREGAQTGWPACVSEDIAMMLRYSLNVYRLLFYLNADTRRTEDLDWHVPYGVTAMSLVRSLIDCLYNVTSILQDPPERGPAYRKSGIQRILKDLDEDEKRYGGQANWDSYIAERRDLTDRLMRMSGFTANQIKDQKPWPTLGRYLEQKGPGATSTSHQHFLRTFTYLGWRQYSALSHGAYEAFAGTLGSLPVGSYYINDFLPHDTRPKVANSYELFVSAHLGRAATVLLCMITELQAYCRFDGANINERIRKVWEPLLPLFEAKELYDGRYAKLMAERGIEKR